MKKLSDLIVTHVYVIVILMLSQKSFCQPGCSANLTITQTDPASHFPASTFVGKLCA